MADRPVGLRDHFLVQEVIAMRIRNKVLTAVSAVAVLVAGAQAVARPFPESVPLPDDFQPEGIAVGTD